MIPRHTLNVRGLFRTARRIAARALFGGVLLAPSVRGDVLVLKSGERMDCVVVRESEDKIFVDIGMGEMGLPLSRVAEVVREDAATNVARRATWEKQFAPPPPLPDEWNELAGAYRQLGKLRGKALQAIGTTARDQKQLGNLRQSEKSDAARFSRLSRDVERGQSSRTRRQYADLVENYNRVVARLNENRRHQADIAMRLDQGATAPQDYLKAVARVSALYREESRGVDRDALEEHVVTFLDNIEKGLDTYRGDFTRMEIPVKRRGGGLVVTATVNERGTGTFIVDTGASLVTLSAVAAERLGIRYRDGTRMRMTLADGSEREGYGITLSSVSVGEARETRVAAVVMDDPPGVGVDGLLGMSFLGAFVMNLDGASGDLVLSRFAPR